MSDTSGNLKTALENAARGWPVFPCRPDKSPYTAHGFKDASTDETVIREWWRRFPDARVGIDTGGGGLVVVDVDVKNNAPGHENWAQIADELGAEILETTLTRTQSGGLHYYYRCNGHSIASSAGKLAPGIDIRAQGGYVIAYDFLYGPERLRDLPESLAARLAPNEHQKSAAPVGDAIAEGSRNATLTSFAGTMRHPGMSEEAIAAALLAENDRRCKPPLPASEVRAIAASVARYAPAGTPTTAGPSWPEPLGEAAYHGPLGGLVKVWEPECEADPAALLVTLLVGWGSVVGAGPYHTVNADRHRARLFACVVGDSGNSRKGMSYGPSRRALAKIDPEWDANCREGGLSTGEGLISRVRDRTWKGDPGKQRIDDPGVADKRLFLREEEFARVTTAMSRDKNTLSQIIRNLWDTGDASVLTKGPHDKTTGAHVCLIGNITQSELRRALTECDAKNGFANRFLWVCAKRARSLPRGGNVDLPAAQPLVHALQETFGLIHAGEFDGEIPWSEEAGGLWDVSYEGLFAAGDGLTAAILARSHSQVLRLALTYALADGSHAIELVHLEAALEVWRYCAASVRYIFGDRTGNATADKILDALKHGNLSRTQINELFGGHKLKPELDAALATLAEAGLAHCEKVDEGNSHVEVWRADPAAGGRLR